MKFISGEGFQSRLARPMNNWNSYSLNKNDMEVMWREADGEEAAEIAELERSLRIDDAAQGNQRLVSGGGDG